MSANRETYLNNLSNLGPNLCKGKVVLLAKAICDSLPLPKEEVIDDLSTHMLSHKLNILRVLDVISNVVYISDKDYIYEVVKRFMGWRVSVAYRPITVTFNLDNTAVAEDLTHLCKFIDPTELSAVAGVHNNGSYTYSVFKDIATYVLKGEQ